MSSSAERAGGGASIDAPLTAWADAERTNDAAAPETLRRLDFTGVGPAGFIASGRVGSAAIAVGTWSTTPSTGQPAELAVDRRPPSMRESSLR